MNRTCSTLSILSDRKLHQLFIYIQLYRNSDIYTKNMYMYSYIHIHKKNMDIHTYVDVHIYIYIFIPARLAPSCPPRPPPQYSLHLYINKQTHAYTQAFVSKHVYTYTHICSYVSIIYVHTLSI